ncbi:MAG: DUF2937 family protein [Bacteroidales bacterium]|nr:DUF2937 family protein [Bacteroidales bacterium]MCF8386623.1 DUF2937 family protein [Bacteroidales bacterium]MCF8397739.1 DUF2937 family protein [Bacteroidales bacterium]
MGFKKWTGRRIDRLFTAIAGLAGGVAAGQFPQYIAQYLQRLGGHIDEARRSALEFGIPELTQRARELEEGMQAIQEASILGKIFAFFRHADWNIAGRAWEHFTPGITFDPEGLIYMLIGSFIGFVIYDLFTGLFQ